MIAKESFSLPNRRSRRKNQLQSSQEMVNAVDKVSMSIRRAFNVNRCQQDHLDNRVWTLEQECRQSLGLLSLEQRKFIRSRKPPAAGLKINGRTRDVPEISSTDVSKLAHRNSLKGFTYLPTLVNDYKFQFKEHPIRGHPSFQGGFQRLKERQRPKKQQSDDLVRLPPITETTLNKQGSHEYKETSKVKWTSMEDCETEDVIDSTEKQDVTPSSEVVENENDLQINTRTSNQNDVASRASSNMTEIGKESQNHLLPSKPSLIIRSNSNFGNELPDSDKTTEIKVKKFLKLPPIGGIQETVDLPDDSNEDQIQTRRRRKFNFVKQHQSVEIKDKSLLWKNLVHCRYLRLSNQHQPEKILDETCRCNWCSMMKKNQL